MTELTGEQQKAAYDAAHASAALFDLSSRDELTLTGSDRVSFLQGFCTNDVKKLAAGSICEAFIPNVKGRAVGHVFVSAEDDRLTLDSVPGANEALLPHLDRYLITEDVELKSTTSGRCLFYVTGPTASETLKTLWAEAAKLQPLTLGRYSESGFEVVIRRMDWLGQPGFAVSLPPEQADEIKSQLLTAGALAGDADTWEALRIEACFPTHGLDFDAGNLVQEVDRIQQGISFYKGCYLGQEPIARIDALGHVNKMLRGLKFAIPAGSELASLVGSELKVEGVDKPVGTVRSVAKIPGEVAGETGLAMAIVRREQSAPETAVTIQTESGPVPATLFWR